jgi:hypothetical protein
MLHYLQVPLILTKYFAEIDTITLDVKQAGTTKVKITSDCDSKAQEARNGYTLLLTRYALQPNGVVSKSIVATYLSQIEDVLKTEKSNKLAKYDEIVSNYNRALVTQATVPLIDSVSFYYR